MRIGDIVDIGAMGTWMRNIYRQKLYKFFIEPVTGIEYVWHNGNWYYAGMVWSGSDSTSRNLENNRKSTFYQTTGVQL